MDRADARAEEVRGGLRSHPPGCVESRRGGVGVRTFRRWRDRCEAEGAEGLYDRRLGRASARRAGVDEAAHLLELFDTRYRDFNARHFHEKLVAEHGVQRSYNWVRLTLQAHGRVRAAPRRPPAQAPAPGAAGHGTRTAHAGRPVGSGRHPRRCHLRGLLLRRRGGCQLPGPPRGGARAVRSTPAVTTSTPRRPAARSTRTTRPKSGAPCANSAASPPTPPRRGGGACSSPCRSACPKNSGSPSTSTRPTASSNRSTCPATTPASQPRPRGSAFVPFAGTLDDIPCRGAHRLQRQHRARDVACNSRPTATATSRPGSGSTPTTPSPSSKGASPATAATANPSTPTPARLRDPLRRNQARPCGEVDGRYAPVHFPTGPTTPTEAVNPYIIPNPLFNDLFCGSCSSPVHNKRDFSRRIT